MRISLTLPNDEIATIDVTEATTLSQLKMLVSIECTIPPEQIGLLKDGGFLTGTENTTLGELNVKNMELIQIVKTKNPQGGSAIQGIRNLRNQASDMFTQAQAKNVGGSGLDFSGITLPGTSNSPSDSVEMARQMLLMSSPYELSAVKERNPELAAVINDPAAFRRVYTAQKDRANNHEVELAELMLADQFDPQVQARISELIQQKNIDAQMETAIEHYPETFGQVTMLYVNCKVHGHPIKAFVDSGAQTTIMSQDCAKRCSLDRLIDKRWAGKAYGVGTQNIIGRVHNSLIEIGSIFIPTSFIVLQDQQLDLLIGLDMLKRHQCTIDLRKNVLNIDDRVEVAFLPESELPLAARHPDLAEAVRSSGEPSSPPQANSLLNAAMSNDQQNKVNQLISQGVPQKNALAELRSSNWDLDAAFASYLAKNP
ncbi:hypothetical protein Ciccas_000182 [Cichlidogyrus casuarinus]|uniref:DNA damage-inducible protein 1 n=1 Tax=Cichlidogyrus casuarinus TaxID=1844966 RepID=A0ABD2QNN9_9PLAT